MKSGPLTMVIKGALALSLVLSVVFFLQFTFLTRELRSLNAQAATANLQRNQIQALAVDCLEYSKKNPAIYPMLKSVGLDPAAVK